MKCPKCGYFSFDYLTECGKCGVGLGEVKEKLGLVAIKPSVPFFLGSLLKDGTPPEGVADDWDGQTASTGTNLAEIEFGEDYDLSIGPAEDDSTAVKRAPLADSEFSLFDLGVPELQEEIHGVRSGGGETPQRMKPAPVTEPPAVSSSVSVDASASGAESSRRALSEEDEEGLTLDLTIEDFEEKGEIQDAGPAVVPPSEPQTGVLGGKDLDSTATAPLALDDAFPHDLVLELDDVDTERAAPSKADSRGAMAVPSLSPRETRVESAGGLSPDFDKGGLVLEEVGIREDRTERQSALDLKPERLAPTGSSPFSGEELVLELVEDGSTPGRGIQTEKKPAKLEVPSARADLERTEIGAGSRERTPGETQEHGDDMVIELSDDDLETILTGLEEISEDNGKPPGSSGRKKQ